MRVDAYVHGLLFTLLGDLLVALGVDIHVELLFLAPPEFLTFPSSFEHDRDPLVRSPPQAR